MSASDVESRAAWLREEVAKGQTGAARRHPDLEEMAAYAEGGLDDGRRAEIAEHLVACSGCSRLVLELAQDLAVPVGAASSSETAARWELIHPRLVEEGLALPKPAAAMAATTAVTALEAPAAPRPHGGWRLGAAGLTMALLASLVFNGLQWKLASQPKIVAEEVQLAVTRGDADVQVIALGERSRSRVLELRIDANSVEPLPGLKAEIYTWPEKKLLWEGELEREGAELTLAVPTSFLASREYRIAVSGRTADGWRPLVFHTLRIADAAAEPAP